MTVHIWTSAVHQNLGHTEHKHECEPAAGAWRYATTLQQVKGVLSVPLSSRNNH